MRMTKTERLQQAYADLKSGKIIQFIPDEDKRKLKRGCGCKCWIRESTNPNCKRKFIFWKYFGQSANRMSLNELRWIAKNIADCTTYEYEIVSNIY